MFLKSIVLRMIRRTPGIRNTPKPSPYCLEYLMSKYDIPKEEVCYVGDAMNDMLAARNAGIDGIYISGDNHLSWTVEVSCHDHAIGVRGLHADLVADILYFLIRQTKHSGHRAGSCFTGSLHGLRTRTH